MANTDPSTSRKAEKVVVVVEDEQDLAESIVMLLELEGYSAAYALSDSSGLALAKAKGADAVLLDYRLPDMTGGEVATLLRSNPATRDVKIVMCTSTPEAEVRASFTGYAAYLSKPVAHHRLVRVLAAEIGK